MRNKVISVKVKRPKNCAQLSKVLFKCTYSGTNPCTFAGKIVDNKCGYMKFNEMLYPLCMCPEAQRAAVLRFTMSGDGVDKITKERD